MRIDHVNIRCTDLQATSAFLQSVVGLTIGPRPPFPFPGYWLYDQTGRAVVHLIAASESIGKAGPVDHVAFRYDDLRPQLNHLASLGYRCEPKEVPGIGIHQCFVFGPDGVQIEFQGVLNDAG